MKKKTITLEEKKTIQLEMLKEIDSFCKANSICYSLAFGTLLGAIRHKGFIPWDDDIDIMMPLPDMLRFKELFHSDTMKYYDIDIDPFFRFAFARVANTQTFNQLGLICQTYGICVDVYPVVAIPNTIDERKAFFDKAIKLEKRCEFVGKWRYRAIRYLPVKSIPFYKKSVRELTEHLRYSCKYGETGYYYTIAGPIVLCKTMTYDFDIFKEIIEVEFEKNRFLSIAAYDKFLTLRYGDYMTPPPENQRHPYHGGNFFWKQ